MNSEFKILNNKNISNQSDTSQSKDSIKTHIIYLSNKLLKSSGYDSSLKLKYSIPKKIKSIDQVNSNLFVFFYEAILQNTLIDKKWPIVSFEDEIHNAQAVIDSLSLDILHEDLSHLTGEAICGNFDNTSSNQKQNGDCLTKNKRKIDYVSVEYLLDILMSIKEWIQLKKNTDCHSDDQSMSPNSSKITDLKLDKCDMSQTKLPFKISLKDETLKNNDKDDYIFKNYMIEMENKYNNSINNIDNLKKLDSFKAKTFETNEFIKEFNTDQNERINQIINDFSSVSLSPASSSNDIENKNDDIFQKSKNAIINSKIHTVENELNLIKSNITSNCNKTNEYLNNFINYVYKNDLDDAKFMYNQSLNNIKHYGDITEKLFSDSCEADNIFFSRNKIKPKSIKKGVLLPKKTNRRSRSTFSNRSTNVNKIKNSKRPTSLKYDNHLSRIIIGENGLLNFLLEQFPYLYTSPETIHYLWRTHSKQMELLSKKQMEIEKKYICEDLNNLQLDDSKTNFNQKSKTQIIFKDLYNKQKAFMDILKKDMKHKQRIEDQKKLKTLENALKAEQREQRFRNAKSKRYYEEMCLEKKARMLQQSTTEELVFKNLFNDNFKLQKERLLELERYAKEKNQLSVEKQLNNLQSIQNFYKRKFEILKEDLISEKNEKNICQKSQHNILNKLKFNYKGMLRSQILDLQQQMCRDNDHLYWRKMDSDRLKTEIQRASYI